MCPKGNGKRISKYTAGGLIGRTETPTEEKDDGGGHKKSEFPSGRSKKAINH